MAEKGKKFKKVPAKAFEESNKRGKYEEKLSVDISFEELVKLSVSDDKEGKQKEEKPKLN